MIHRLFWKLVLSFWLIVVLVAITGAWLHILAVRKEPTQVVSPHLQGRIENIVNRVGQGLERRPQRTRFDLPRDHRKTQVRVFDAAGDRIFGPPLRPALRHLRSVEEPTRGDGFYAIPIQRSGETWRVVGTVPIPPWARPRVALWLRISVGLLISGLVSWLLARYLTRPIARLRWASQQLAAGDLDTRVNNQEQGYGKDEIGQLGRDFDHMAEQLQRSYRTQQQLLRDVSHELRSPLARLQLAVGLARQQLDDRADKELHRIEAETEKLDELIGEVLTLSRELHDDSALDLGEIDITELLKLIVDDAQFEAAQTNRRISLQHDEPSILLQGDTRLLSRALENVVRNALMHTGDGDEVSVTVQADENSVSIKVADSGPGVPEAQLEQIFQSFHRVDSARSGRGGYGLGLAIAQHAIARHGGQIRAQNRAEGGLLMVIQLPRRSSS